MDRNPEELLRAAGYAVETLVAILERNALVDRYEAETLMTVVRTIGEWIGDSDLASAARSSEGPPV
jgi:hypothetical protein